MISPEEFVQRCERAAEARAEDAVKQERGMRELVALCSLTEYTFRRSYPNTGEIQIEDRNDRIVFAGKIRDALHQLVEELPRELPA